MAKQLQPQAVAADQLWQRPRKSGPTKVRVIRVAGSTVTFELLNGGRVAHWDEATFLKRYSRSKA